MSLVSVCFNGPFGAYHLRDVAGFPPAEAARLCNTPISAKGQPEIMLARMATPEDVAAYSARIGASAAKEPEKLVSVQITGRVPRYRMGEIAGFPESEARRMVEVDKTAIYNPEADAMKAEAEKKAEAAAAAKSKERAEAKAARNEQLRRYIKEAVDESLKEHLGPRLAASDAVLGLSSPVTGKARVPIKKG